MKELIIVGGGLAGSEAAWQALQMGVKVTMYEMRNGEKQTPAHQTDNLAELVCSNSFRACDYNSSAIGLLHEEMRKLDSLIISSGDKNAIPAGGALAVDRENFSRNVTATLLDHQNFTLIRNEISDLKELEGKLVIIASGPLTSDNLSMSILRETGLDQLAFFDAIAPIIYKESIDFSKAWMQSRYNKTGNHGTGSDYINCPMSKEQYYNFIDALQNAQKTEFKEWEKDTPYFESCLPIEVMAERGVETLRFGPMKPVGLDNPHSEEKPYAVVQLRQDNKIGTLYNMVGFQTKLKYGEQQKIFKMIPGLENAEFARLGGIHRNTFINSPKLLDNQLRLKSMPNVRFAGQITGVEGYIESASIGLLAGRFAACELLEEELFSVSDYSAIGSLLKHITYNAESETFQPMNINYGLIPQLDKKVRDKKLKKQMVAERSLQTFELYSKHS